MTEQARNHGRNECGDTENPAEQPHPPGNDCEPLPESSPPCLEPPEPCEPYAECHCPTTGKTSNCLDDLIAAHTQRSAAAEKASPFTKKLEEVRQKAKAGAQEYARSAYDKLKKDWVKQDGEISELIRKLVCAVECWRCILECHVCPSINELIQNERWLYGDGNLYDKVRNLHDLQYWHQRDTDGKRRRLKRIEDVLAAWEKPAQRIEKALADNAKLISDLEKNLGSGAPKLVYDLFFKLVPMHLAIAPPSGSGVSTKIEKKFTEFCTCDEGEPDACCGPDVGRWSIRRRLVGPQPYLIDPNDYYGVICCLVEQRYVPAHKALMDAEAALQATTERIQRYSDELDKLSAQAFETKVKAAIPAEVNCCTDYKKPRDQAAEAS